MSTYSQTDRCTDLILDFVASVESGGNYNAYYTAPASVVPLITWPLDQIYAFQRSMTVGSTATGRYQFLLDTLQGLQGELGLPGTAIFSPALQDRLGVALLVRRGYSAWWRREISDVDLAHRLSMEWASLPDPQRAGRSYYDGDAMGNHALTSLAAVYAMLAQARALQNNTAPAAPAAPGPGLSDAARQRLMEIDVGQRIYLDEIRRLVIGA